MWLPFRRLKEVWMQVIRKNGFIKIALLVVMMLITIAWAEKICPKCGTVNPDNAKFCKSCGAKLPEPEVRPSLPALEVGVDVSGNTVRITSQPSGASVTIDGFGRGTTPLEVENLSPGKHTVEVRYPGHRTYSGSFNITARLSTLVITTDPIGAEILVDGVYRGKTTENGLVVSKVPFGSRSILARYPGYEEATKLVEVSNPGPIGVLVKMGKGRGFLSVETKPEGADVLANGRRIGTSNMLVGLAPARYTLMCSKTGYADWLGYVEVKVGETTYVQQILQRLPRRQLPVLLAGFAFLAGGVGAGVVGEKSYNFYQKAETKQDAVNYRRATERWDIIRNVALGIGTIGIGMYFVVRW
ncbi:MAG: PEGA domain-containing protein [bacterium]